MSRQNTISDFPGCHADGARENDRSAIASAAWAMNSLRGVRNRGWLSRPRPLHGASFCPASPIGRTRSLVAAVVDSFTSDAIERERSMSVAVSKSARLVLTAPIAFIVGLILLGVAMWLALE